MKYQGESVDNTQKGNSKCNKKQKPTYQIAFRFLFKT